MKKAIIFAMDKDGKMTATVNGDAGSAPVISRNAHKFMDFSLYDEDTRTLLPIAFTKHKGYNALIKMCQGLQLDGALWELCGAAVLNWTGKDNTEDTKAAAVMAGKIHKRLMVEFERNNPNCHKPCDCGNPDCRCNYTPVKISRIKYTCC